MQPNKFDKNLKNSKPVSERKSESNINITEMPSTVRTNSYFRPLSILSSLLIFAAAILLYNKSFNLAFSFNKVFTKATQDYNIPLSNTLSRNLATMTTQEEIDQLGIKDALNGTPFSLPLLPYKLGALEQVISSKTMSVHYGKHHATYVRKLNELVKDTKFASMQLEDVIKNSEGPIFNNAAQHWNHMFFWKILSPTPNTEPNGSVKTAIESSFGSIQAFKDKFLATAIGQFGSGWAWLVKKSDGTLVCEGTPNGVNPISTGSGKPLLGLDVWEHAYYLDYMQDRPSYVKGFLTRVNWEEVNKNYNSK